MVKNIKLIGNILYILLVLFVFIIVGGTVLSVSSAPGGFRMFVVNSGSMEPSIKTGSVVLVKENNNYSLGDVITYLSTPGASIKKPDSTTTHRIVELAEDNAFVTKGDANATVDISAVKESQVLGKVLVSFPYIGYLFSFSQTQAGFILLIVIPGVIVVYNEILNAKKEIVKLLDKKKKVEDKNE